MKAQHKKAGGRLQAVSIRRLTKVVAPPDKEPAGQDLVATLGANLLALGYALNSVVLEQLQSSSEKTLVGILKAAKTIKGVAKYKPMYPNFPEQVINASDAELYINASLHYLGDWIGVRIMPKYKKTLRKPLHGTVSVTALGVATEADLVALAEAIMTQGQPFSPQDTEDLAVLEPFVTRALPVAIKENFAALATLFPQFDWSESCHTATDVLRLATSLSEGDVSLCPGSSS